MLNAFQRMCIGSVVGCSFGIQWLTIQPAFSFVGVSASATVNFLDKDAENSSSFDGIIGFDGSPFRPTVNSSASGANTSVSASASVFPLTARTFATSTDSLFSNNGLSGSGFSADYNLEGADVFTANGLTIPLDFNFNLTGSLEASSTPGDRLSFGNAAYGYSLSNVPFGTGSLGTTRRDFAAIVSQAGIPTVVSSRGTLPKASFTPTFSIEGSDPFKIDPNDFNQVISLAPQLSVLTELQEPEAFEIDFSTGLALQALNLLIDKIPANKRSLPDGLGGGAIDVGFDVSFTLDEMIPIQVDIGESGGNLGLTLSSEANSVEDGEGTADLSNTFKLDSISFAEGFDPTGLEDLSVVFDSGYRVKVDALELPSSTPQPSSDPSLEQPIDNPAMPLLENPQPVSVPEPSGLTGILMFAGISAASRKLFLGRDQHKQSRVPLFTH